MHHRSYPVESYIYKADLEVLYVRKSYTISINCLVRYHGTIYKTLYLLCNIGQYSQSVPHYNASRRSSKACSVTGDRRTESFPAVDAPVYSCSNDDTTCNRSSVVHVPAIDRQHRWERHPNKNEGDIGHCSNVDKRAYSAQLERPPGNWRMAFASEPTPKQKEDWEEVRYIECQCWQADESVEGCARAYVYNCK